MQGESGQDYVLVNQALPSGKAGQYRWSVVGSHCCSGLLTLLDKERLIIHLFASVCVLLKLNPGLSH